MDAKVYSTYYTTRKDNAWAKANPDEVQQCYIMHRLQHRVWRAAEHPADAGHQPRADAGQHPRRHQALVGGHGPHHRASRWTPPPGAMRRRAAACVIDEPAAFHDYTVSFLAYLIWDPVHMYNAVTNGWTNFEHQITFDVRQPKTHKFTMERLRKFIAEHPYVNVIRYTTFFHQFTLVFDELKREKYVDWYGYSASRLPLHPGAVREGGGLQVPPRVHHRPGLLQQPVPGAQQGIQGLPWPSSAGRWPSWPRRWWTSPTSWARRP